MHSNWVWAALAVQAVQVQAQFPPPREGISKVKSKHHEGITISYKEPGICETTPGVKSYSGYVHLPPNSLGDGSQDYPINTFFWFFESRKDPHHAPLSIWLNGGPGGSSSLGLLAENGPCSVNSDSNSTTLNPWSWNNEVNMLYIDQPVQVGYSYDVLSNGTKNLAMDNQFDEQGHSITLQDFADGVVPEQNATYMVGTFASQNLTRTANSTNHAAVAMWHFAQTWFEEFPVYKPHDEKISLWTESYGGIYGPAFVDYFTVQNEKISNGTISGPGVHYLNLDTLGIINGCVDPTYCARGYAAMAYNNTYGIKAVNETFHHKQMYEMDRPGGIVDQIEECQEMARKYDPDEHGDIDEVNQLCVNASNLAGELLVGAYMAEKKYGWFDITHPSKDPFPPMYEVGYLNQDWVQKALGVPVNHTWHSEAVSGSFDKTGDMSRPGRIEDIAYLLDHGVKVALVYGDRDFACNWIGGEMTSLNIPYKYNSEFSTAGYTAVTVGDPYSPPFVPYGLTRQHGNFSFTRVFQAGHMVPSYQPEASHEIFLRSLFNKDIATGTIDLTATGGWAGVSEDKEIFKTEGPGNTWWRLNEVMPAPEPECYTLVPSTCSDEQRQLLGNGTAIIKDWILVGVEDASREIENVDHSNGSREQMVLGQGDL